MENESKTLDENSLQAHIEDVAPGTAKKVFSGWNRHFQAAISVYGYSDGLCVIRLMRKNPEGSAGWIPEKRLGVDSELIPALILQLQIAYAKVIDTQYREDVRT
jgi:hypothetical protein